MFINAPTIQEKFLLWGKFMLYIKYIILLILSPNTPYVDYTRSIRSQLELVYCVRSPKGQCSYPDLLASWSLLRVLCVGIVHLIPGSDKVLTGLFVRNFSVEGVISACLGKYDQPLIRLPRFRQCGIVVRSNYESEKRVCAPAPAHTVVDCNMSVVVFAVIVAHGQNQVWKRTAKTLRKN